MKFTIEKTALLSGLQKVQGVVQARSTMPILSNVRMEAGKDQVQLFATDLEIGLQDSVAATVEQPGKITVSAKKLYEIARESREGTLQMDAEETREIMIRTGKSSFKLRGLSADEFPSFPEIRETGRIRIPAAVLSEMIKKTVFSISSDLTRPALNGALVHFPGAEQSKIEMVATDGHRLAQVIRELKISGTPKEQKVIVPKKTLFELRKYLEEGEPGEMEIVLSDKHILFQEGSYILLSRLIDGRFPNYEEVIPRENPRSVSLDRELLQGAVRRVSILSDEKTHAIKLNFRKGELQISSNNPEMGEADEVLATDYTGEEASFGFNVRYMQDITSALSGEEVRIHFLDAASPVRIEDPGDAGFVGVIMPMRV